VLTHQLQEPAAAIAEQATIDGNESTTERIKEQTKERTKENTNKRRKESEINKKTQQAPATKTVGPATAGPATVETAAANLTTATVGQLQQRGSTADEEAAPLSALDKLLNTHVPKPQRDSPAQQRCHATHERVASARVALEDANARTLAASRKHGIAQRKLEAVRTAPGVVFNKEHAPGELSHAQRRKAADAKRNEYQSEVTRAERELRHTNRIANRLSGELADALSDATDADTVVAYGQSNGGPQTSRAASATTAPTRHTSDAGTATTAAWTCSRCTLDNVPGTPRCTACGGSSDNSTREHESHVHLRIEDGNMFILGEDDPAGFLTLPGGQRHPMGPHGGALTRAPPVDPWRLKHMLLESILAPAPALQDTRGADASTPPPPPRDEANASKVAAAETNPPGAPAGDRELAQRLHDAETAAAPELDLALTKAQRRQKTKAGQKSKQRNRALAKAEREAAMAERRCAALQEPAPTANNAAAPPAQQRRPRQPRYPAAPAATAAKVAPSTFIATVRVLPHGVLGAQRTGAAKEVVHAEGPTELKGCVFVDPAGLHLIQGSNGGPSGAGGAAGAIYKHIGIEHDSSFPPSVVGAVTKTGDAKYHVYAKGGTDAHVIHAVGPDLRKDFDPTAFPGLPFSREQAVAALALTYRNILREFVASGQPILRLLPMSGGIYCGDFAGEIAALTFEALQRGHGLLLSSETTALANDKQLGLCVFMEDELGAFVAAGFRRDESALQPASTNTMGAAATAPAVHTTTAANPAPGAEVGTPVGATPGTGVRFNTIGKRSDGTATTIVFGPKPKPRKAVVAHTASLPGPEATQLHHRPDAPPGHFRMRIMLDSGATVPLLTTTTGDMWGGQRTHRVSAVDAQGHTFIAHGGSPLAGRLADEAGQLHDEVLADDAFVADTLTSDLLGLPALKRRGWGLESPPGMESLNVLISPTTGRRYPIELDDTGHMFLEVILRRATDTRKRPLARPTPRHRIILGDAARVHHSTTRRNGPERATWASNIPEPTTATAADTRTTPPIVATAPNTPPPVRISTVPGERQHAVYVHKDGRRETVEVRKTYYEGEGGGHCVYIPSLGRERDIPSEKLETTSDEKTAAPNITEVLDEKTAVTEANEQLKAADAAAIKEAAAKAKLEWMHRNYVMMTNAFNHDDSALDAAIAQKLFPHCKRPPGYQRGGAVERSDPSGAKWRRNTKAGSSVPMVPYHWVEIDLWGPMDVGDRNELKYMFGAIDRASGIGFMQPIRQKSDALGAMKSFMKLVRARSPGIQQHMRFKFAGIEVPGLNVVSSDRGGEFTTTYGFTKSRFDELLDDIWHRLNTPDTPESGTTSIERLWRSMSEAAKASLFESGLGKQYFFDAMVYANDVRNMLPTASNKVGKGEAPVETLGLDYDLRLIVPFGSFGYLHEPGAKVDDPANLVVILGFNHDGPGYRALRVADPGKDIVVTSVNIRAVPGTAPLKETLEKARADPKSATEFLLRHYNMDSNRIDLSGAASGQLRDLASPTGAAQPNLKSHQVGNPPGNGGSRTLLLDRTKSRNVGGARKGQTAGASPHTRISDVEARRTVRDARAAGLVLRWKQGQQKRGKSGERYLFYSTARTFDQFDKLTKEQFLSGTTGGMRPKAVTADLTNDVKVGLLTFVVPDTPDTPDTGTPPEGDTDAAAVPNADPGADTDAAAVPNADPGADTTDSSDSDDSDDDDADIDTEHGPAQPDLPSPSSIGLRRSPRKLVRAAAAHMKRTLTTEQRNLMFAGLQARSAYVAVPDIVMAAAVKALGIKIPRSLKEAQRSPQWPQWLAALEKEYGGLISEGVFKEVDRSSVPTDNKVVPTQLLFSIKSDGTFKCRIVVRGDLTTKGKHYLETKSSMASIEAVRMLASFAAGEQWPMYGTDFSQAYTNADELNEYLFCELTTLPPEMQDGRYGAGKGRAKVAHMKKNLYGLPQAGKAWQDYLMKWLTEELDFPTPGAEKDAHCRLFINDRNLFEWKWQGHKLYAAAHVDDLLFAASSPEIRIEFVRRLRQRFRMTGGEEEASEFCGIEIRRDWEKQTVTLHQEKFARQMMEKYAVMDAHDKKTPFKVSDKKMEPWDGMDGEPKLEAWDGEPTEIDVFDYMGFLGELSWYSRTNPGLAFAVHELAQFMQRPGPAHVAACQHVLRYIRGNLSAGLTYHGSDEVLNQSYPHRHKLILTGDADFPHNGSKATSGAAVLMNGAAIAWKVRRQTTVSQNTTEAEVKAMCPGVEMIRGLTDLWSEFTSETHGRVRTMVDSQAAQAQVDHGMESKKCASFKRAHFYVEDALHRGRIWLDLVPGPHNPSDILTKQCRKISEHTYKNGVLSGSHPLLFETATVARILSDDRTQASSN